MIHVTLFGAYEGRLQPGKRFYLTAFGAADLVRPTMARQLLEKREAEREHRPAAGKPFCLTLFGAMEVKAPTLAEEFIDLREMINSGVLALADFERSMIDLGRGDGSVASFTMFGAFGECELPSEDEEVDGLAVQRHLGNIPESARQILQYGVGQKGTERSVTVRRALAAAT